MNALEVSQRALDAWNRHDADALVAVYAEGGTYHTPRKRTTLSRGKPSATLLKRFGRPFLTRRLRSLVPGDTGGGLVATQWVLHGTHTGPLMDGTPPTGRTVAYPGLPSFKLRPIRSARSTYTLTGRR